MCRQRLHYKAQEMRNQFCKELKKFEMLQNKALDGVRIHRIFQDPYVRIPKKDVIRLTTKQQERLNRILSSNN